MSIALTLLDDVRWHGIPVVGERPQALLAALAAHQGRPVGAAELIDAIWGPGAGGTSVKNLQVLVSRTRSACGTDIITREPAGYRLGAAPEHVDATRLARLVHDAQAALDHDSARAAHLAAEALALAQALAGAPAEPDSGPLADIRRAAAADTEAARLVAARAASRAGAHTQALPRLQTAHARAPHDESLLADLLRSEAAVTGPAAALDRFETYRRQLREAFGTDPSQELARVQRALLAADRPVRHGLRYDATTLIGREGDVARLRAVLAGARVVSVVGAGGLGKTRLAQVMARTAEQPAVYFVELAGVMSAQDLATEVGSVLGVRDSVSGRTTLGARQRSDIRARIAQQLGQVPTLLVLDNCEHLIEAVADLVAFLVAATPDVRVLTTSRAPLAIAAEQLYPLGQLGAADAARLFTERALAARPGAHLPEQVIAKIVRRLDGLPLAIELAAAKVRVMAAEEIDRRLADRFALLRGGDRSAPDRHQGLLTVIEWSWNLLGEADRRALRQLALFYDGFTLAAAEAVLGDTTAGSGAGDTTAGSGAGDAAVPAVDDATAVVDAVQALVDQSLLTVRESPSGLRYRMLETVREYGRMQLARAGCEAAARAALRGWAVRYVGAQRLRFADGGQFAAIDALGAEETNLADELRGAIAEGDCESLVQLLAALGTMWMMRGEHIRLLVVGGGVRDALGEWEPPPQLADVARAAVAVTLNTSLALSGERADLFQVLRRLGPASGQDTYVAALVQVLLTCAPVVDEAFPARLVALAASPDRQVASVAALWLSRHRENEGDLPGALAAAQRVLELASSDADADADAGSWAFAMPHALLAELTMQLGDTEAAVAHALAALPVVERLGANDDEAQLRALLVLCDIGAGRLEQARAQLARIDGIEMRAASFGTDVFRHICRAELLLADGATEAGLRLYRECAQRMHQTEVPDVMRTGTELWSYFGDALVLNAHAWYGVSADELGCGQEMFVACRGSALRVLTAGNERLDYPAAGLLLLSLGAWALLRAAAPAANAVHLVVLAERFAYNRMLPSMAWEPIVAVAQQALAGGIDEFEGLRAQYAGRRPPELLDEARAAARRLPERYRLRR